MYESLRTAIDTARTNMYTTKTELEKAKAENAAREKHFHVRREEIKDEKGNPIMVDGKVQELGKDGRPVYKYEWRAVRGLDGLPVKDENGQYLKYKASVPKMINGKVPLQRLVYEDDNLTPKMKALYNTAEDNRQRTRVLNKMTELADSAQDTLQKQLKSEAMIDYYRSGRAYEDLKKLEEAKKNTEEIEKQAERARAAKEFEKKKFESFVAQGLIDKSFNDPTGVYGDEYDIVIQANNFLKSKRTDEDKLTVIRGQLKSLINSDGNATRNLYKRFVKEYFAGYPKEIDINDPVPYLSLSELIDFYNSFQEYKNGYYNQLGKHQNLPPEKRAAQTNLMKFEINNLRNLIRKNGYRDEFVNMYPDHKFGFDVDLNSLTYEELGDFDNCLTIFMRMKNIADRYRKGKQEVPGPELLNWEAKEELADVYHTHNAPYLKPVADEVEYANIQNEDYKDPE